VHKKPDSARKSADLWHVDHKSAKETMKSIVEAHNISRRTGERWRQERTAWGTPIAQRRMRKFRVHETGSKLGRPFTIPQEKLNAMLKPSNPHRNKPLVLQAIKSNIQNKIRSIQCKIAELPWRCAELERMGGLRVRSKQ
jgi:hypothetical protein